MNAQQTNANHGQTQTEFMPAVARNDSNPGIDSKPQAAYRVPLDLIRELANTQYELATGLHYTPKLVQMKYLISQPTLLQEINSLSQNPRIKQNSRILRQEHHQTTLQRETAAEVSNKTVHLLCAYQTASDVDRRTVMVRCGLVCRHDECESGGSNERGDGQDDDGCDAVLTGLGSAYLPVRGSQLRESLAERLRGDVRPSIGRCGGRRSALGKRQGSPEQSPLVDFAQFSTLSRLSSNRGSRIYPPAVKAVGETSTQVIQTRDLGIQIGFGGPLKNQASQTANAVCTNKRQTASEQMSDSPSMHAVSISVQANFSVVSKKDKSTQM